MHFLGAAFIQEEPEFHCWLLFSKHFVGYICWAGHWGELGRKHRVVRLAQGASFGRGVRSGTVSHRVHLSAWSVCLLLELHLMRNPTWTGSGAGIQGAPRLPCAVVTGCWSSLQWVLRDQEGTAVPAPCPGSLPQVPLPPLT